MRYELQNMHYDKIRNAMAVNCKYIDDLDREYTYFFFIRINEDDSDLDIKNKMEYGIAKITEILANINNNDILINNFIVSGDIKQNKMAIDMEISYHNRPEKRMILNYNKETLNNDISKAISFFEQKTMKEKMKNKINNFKNYMGG